MPSLRNRLLVAEEDFLTSLTDGTDDAICAFEKRWESLVHDINAAANTSDLDDETSTLAHVVATRMSHIAETATDLFSSYNTLTAQLVDQLDGLMSELSLEDATSPVPRSPHPASRLSHRPNDFGSPSSYRGKRRRRDEENDCQVSCSRQRTKRQRLWSAPPASSICPTPSQPCNETALVSIPAVIPFASATSLTGSTSRKRRLSETDATASRCKRFHAGPRLHSVSDSFHIIQQAPQLPTVSDNLLETSSAILSTSAPLDIHPLITSCEDFTGDVFDIGPLIELSHPQDALESSPLLEHQSFDQFLTSLLLPDPKGTALQVVPSRHDDHWSLGDSHSTTPTTPLSPSSNNSPLSARSLSLPPTTPVAISLESPLPQYEVGWVNPNAFEVTYGLDLASIASAPTKPCFDPAQAWSDDPSPPPPFMEESAHMADWCLLPGSRSLDPLSWLSVPPPPYQLPTDLHGPSKSEPQTPVRTLQKCQQTDDLQSSPDLALLA